LRIETDGEDEWKVVLGKYWNLKTLSFRDSPTKVSVMHFGRTKNVSVGYYMKDSKKGVVLDRRESYREL